MAKSLLRLKFSRATEPTGKAFALFRPVLNGPTSTCFISARPAFFGTRRIAPVAAISHVKAEGARPVVEILRPAQRHPQPSAVRPGAPAAPFLTQILATDDASELTAIDVADRYHAAAALMGAPQSRSVATL